MIEQVSLHSNSSSLLYLYPISQSVIGGLVPLDNVPGIHQVSC